ncbi:gastrula zinc finger protein XlCGF28.1-like [Silurus asotus]|uniref:Gastrula zinc finger protein XlCGF28.1-like n=1 Tax=Silurus asotus TaxID=30991 RepID=A0AAD5FIN1_SILAS|nr:gastrula zinc finger protein XlCGF28.1-like [Silurus asotus]
MQHQTQHRDAALIVVGDFNSANLKRALPNFYQHITCPTRGERTLDHCYTTLKNGYKAQSRPPFGKSDHAAIFLMPVYKQRLKQEAPVQREVTRWTDQSVAALQDALDDADWDMFRRSSDDVNMFTEAVVGFIGKLTDDMVQKTTIRTFPNQKPWVDKTIRDALRSRSAAYNTGLATGDMDEYKAASYSVRRAVKDAKRRYGSKLESQFQQGGSRSLWQGLRTITDYKTPSSRMVNADASLADELNTFYARFKAAANHASGASGTTSVHAERAGEVNTFTISEHDVRRAFKRVNTRKAAGPDGITGRVLKACADQLAPVFTEIFNLSLEQAVVPSCFKQSTIVPVPKKPQPACLNDYRPVALTSVVMKCFERLVRDFITASLPDTLDPLQFAYRQNRSTEDAIAHLLHTTNSHLDQRNGNYTKMLFVDYSSAFNTIIPSTLTSKLEVLGLSLPLCQWISNFLTDRPQAVDQRNGNYTKMLFVDYSSAFNTIIPSTLTSKLEVLGLSLPLCQWISNFLTDRPQAVRGCVLSPLLFSLYTHDCVATSNSTTIIKFADDTVVVGLISNNDETAYLQEVKNLERWCQENNLLLNVSKTKELIVDFSTKQERSYQPLNICGTPVKRVDSFRYLGVHITQDLSWSCHINTLVKKARQRLYHLRRLRDFKLPSQVLKTFYTCTIESVLTGSITSWFGNSNMQDRPSRGWCVQLNVPSTASSLTCTTSTAHGAGPEPEKL